MPTHQLLTQFPVVLELPVQWGEMDAYGHVNNAMFFRYFESARMIYLERAGFVESHAESEIGAILHSTSCRFRIPLHYPDRIQIGARARDIKEDRFSMEYVVVSLSLGAIVAEGSGVIVSFDYAAGRKAPLPEEVRRRITSIEGTSS
ncbi:MAG: thioesterase family protein [Gemmatimonadota bacterium]